MTKQKVIRICLFTASVITAVFNIIMYFRLPEKMATQIGTGGAKTTPSLLFLIISAFMVAASSLMYFFSYKSNPKRAAKWPYITAILFVLNLVTILINL